MNKNKKNLVREFRNDDPTTYLTNKDQQKAMLKEDIKAKKIEEARKKIMVEPIDIPVNVTIPHRPLDLSEDYTRPRKVINPDGLSRRFTQRKLQEGKILEQVDKELANEKMNNERMKDE